MTRIERRVLRNCTLTGTLLTSLTLLVSALGWLQMTENWMYDLRARHFQFFTPPPTDQLVHLDIDDKSLDAIGYWPWPRARWAELIDEIHSAGAKAVALDVLFPEAQTPEFRIATTPEGVRSVQEQIDNDALFATALARAGNVLIPASVGFDPPTWTELQLRAIAAFEQDLELTESELIAHLRVEGFKAPDLDGLVRDSFLPTRREGAFRRVMLEMSTEPQTLEQLRKKLLKRSDESIKSPLTRLVEDQFEKCRNARAIARFGSELPRNIPPLLPGNLALAPIWPLASSAAASAFVDYKTARDGVLRSVPLVVDCNGRALPQMGLSLALLWLGARPQDMQYTANSITLCCPDGRRIVIPVRTVESAVLHRPVPMTFDIPWFGGKRWESMYDWPRHQEAVQHLPLNVAWDPYSTRQKIIGNNRNADVALSVLKEVLGLPALKAPLEDTAARLAAVDHALKEAEATLDAYQSMKPEEIDESGRVFLRAIDALKAYTPQIKLLQEQLVFHRDKLARALKEKAVVVGWTATGRQDVTPTSLHAGCPGTVAHGVIFSSIVTGHFWRGAPPWTAWAITILLGLVTAGISARFSPPMAFVLTSLLGTSYVAVNGLILFDRLGYLVDLAMPQIAMIAVWSGCTLVRIVIESQERARITRRFRAYVDPTLVNYVIERPDEVRLEGETRELTVCFSDLVGFTALSERMGERIVLLLNEFMGLQVPVIRAEKGYVNKFLGDGIMFFFGAPIHNPDHASDAVRTALRMQEKIIEFNQTLLARQLPTVAMRIGVSTGTVVVGDAGSKDASDYTVLGDPVNLGSRLESANKMVGTSILISQRTQQLIGAQFLIRPVGLLQVVGKTEGVLAFDVRNFAERATEEEVQLCQLTSRMVEQYRAGQFAQAMQSAAAIEQRFGPGKLTGIYNELCRQFIAQPPGDGFDGKIVFTEK